MRSTVVLPASFANQRHVSYAVCILFNNSSLSSQQGYPAYISFTGDSKGEQSDYVIPVECDTSAPQHGAAAGYRRSVSTMLLGCWFLNEDNHRQKPFPLIISFMFPRCLALALESLSRKPCFFLFFSCNYFLFL